MAVDHRHAAGQKEATFAVRVLGDGGAESELAASLGDLGDATDVAFEWLNRADPAREGTVRLAIVRLDGDGSETVWTYPPPPAGPGQELISVFGFNPATWQPQSPNRPPREEIRRTLPPPRPSSPRRPDLPAADSSRAPVEPRVTSDAPAVAEPGPGPGGERARRNWAALARSAVAAVSAGWDDLFARGLLIFAVFALWFFLALREPACLVVALGLLAGLRMRLQRLEPLDDPDDL
jgi:hypothetical protein